MLKIVQTDRYAVAQPGNQTRGCQREMRLKTVNAKI